MAILDEGREEGREAGREEEARKLILNLGKKRFGRITKTTKAKLEAITDIAALEKLAEYLLEVSSWKELLATMKNEN